MLAGKFAMPVSFTCPACGRALEAPDAALGRPGICKFCGAHIVAPTASGQPALLDQAPAPPEVSPGMAWRPAEPARAPGGVAGYAPAPALATADFWQRAVGYLVDFAAQSGIMLILSPLLNAMNPWPAGNMSDLLHALTAGGDPQQALGQVNIVNLALNPLYWWFWAGIVQWLYFALFESSSLQATPGKLLAGTKVTDMEGKRIGFGRATTRTLAKGLSALMCYVGYIMAAFTERRQALHDIIARTLVLKR
jgi:uncharacterized RDD family membrane protein YckC